MGNYRDDVKVARSPIEYTFSWHNEKGEWYGIRTLPDDTIEKFLCFDLNFVILEPSTFCVTGKTEDGGHRINSNLAKRGVFDQLHVYKRVREGNRTNRVNIASGVWGGDNGIKNKVKGAGGQWTRSVIAFARVGKIQLLDANDQRIGEPVNRQFGDDNQGALCQLRLRGGAIMIGWQKFVDSTGKETDNLDGMYVKQRGNFEYLNEKRGRTYKYPSMTGHYLDAKNPDFKALNDLCAGKYFEVQTYLQEHWERVGSYADNSSAAQTPFDTPVEQPVEQPQASPPSNTSGPSADDDLPF